jgi:hypothetical protein
VFTFFLSLQSKRKNGPGTLEAGTRKGTAHSRTGSQGGLEAARQAAQRCAGRPRRPACAAGRLAATGAPRLRVLPCYDASPLECSTRRRRLPPTGRPPAPGLPPPAAPERGLGRSAPLAGRRTPARPPVLRACATPLALGLAVPARVWLCCLLTAGQGGGRTGQSPKGLWQFGPWEIWVGPWQVAMGGRDGVVEAQYAVNFSIFDTYM